MATLHHRKMQLKGFVFLVVGGRAVSLVAEKYLHVKKF